MKTTIKTEKEVELKIMHVSAGVRYWEDAVINGEEHEEGWDGEGVPCKQGETWAPIIDIDNGRITNWEIGKTASIHFKVCDCCSWYFMDSQGNKVAEVINEYVPACLCPEENGYGDYIIMEIDAEGKIQGWEPESVNELFEE